MISSVLINTKRIKIMKSKIIVLSKTILYIIIFHFMLFCLPGSATASHPGIRVAMIQMDVIDGNLSENLKRAEKSIREAASMGADLVCLPEAADLGWLYQMARRDATSIPGKYTDSLSELAKNLKFGFQPVAWKKTGIKLSIQLYLSIEKVQSFLSTERSKLSQALHHTSMIREVLKILK